MRGSWFGMKKRHDRFFSNPITRGFASFSVRTVEITGISISAMHFSKRLLLEKCDRSPIHQSVAKISRDGSYFLQATSKGSAIRWLRGCILGASLEMYLRI